MMIDNMSEVWLMGGTQSLPRWHIMLLKAMLSGRDFLTPIWDWSLASLAKSHNKISLNTKLRTHQHKRPPFHRILQPSQNILWVSMWNSTIISHWQMRSKLTMRLTQTGWLKMNGWRLDSSRNSQLMTKVVMIWKAGSGVLHQTRAVTRIRNTKTSNKTCIVPLTYQTTERLNILRPPTGNAIDQSIPSSTTTTHTINESQSIDSTRTGTTQTRKTKMML